MTTTETTLKNTPELFVDGVQSVSFSNGMVRMELATVDPTKKDNDGNNELQTRQRVITSLQGFLQAYGAMDNLMNKLVESGAVKKKEAEEKPKE